MGVAQREPRRPRSTPRALLCSCDANLRRACMPTMGRKKEYCCCFTPKRKSDCGRCSLRSAEAGWSNRIRSGTDRVGGCATHAGQRDHHTNENPPMGRCSIALNIGESGEPLVREPLFKATRTRYRHPPYSLCLPSLFPIGAQARIRVTEIHPANRPRVPCKARPQ